VQETVEHRPHVWVSGKTHGKLYVTLQNLADAAKKSAQNAKRGYKHEHAKHPGDTEADDDVQALSDAAVKEVDEFYVRSFVVGGHVQRAKAYCPKLFTRIRSHFGLSYEAFVRLADVAVDGVWQSGEFFFSSKAHFCYKRISVDERKSVVGMLQEYEKYIHHAHFSLLPHFYGLYTIDGQEFLLTNNVFHCVDTIEIMYDLKGCWFRETPLEERAGRHYIMPIGTVADRAELHDTSEVPVAQYHSRIINDEKLRHLLHSGNEWAKEAAFVLHEVGAMNDRCACARAEIGVYARALVCFSAPFHICACISAHAILTHTSRPIPYLCMHQRLVPLIDSCSSTLPLLRAGVLELCW